MAFKDFFKIQKQGLECMASVGVIGMHMVSGPLVGVAIGYGIDRFFDTHPWGKIVFLFIGIGAGFLNVYMDTKRLIGQMDKGRGAGSINHARQARETDAPADGPREPRQTGPNSTHPNRLSSSAPATEPANASSMAASAVGASVTGSEGAMVNGTGNGIASDNGSDNGSDEEAGHGKV